MARFYDHKNNIVFSSENAHETGETPKGGPLHTTHKPTK